MRLHPAYTLEQLHQYLAVPASSRPLVSYQPDSLEPENAFSEKESARLREIVDSGDGVYPKAKVSKLLIDLSWASSRLEGNTYTYLDTQTLIEYGQRNEDKPLEEAAMILNHKRAIEFILTHSTLTVDTIQQIHALLADNTLAPNSRHFLEKDRCGVIRSYTPEGFEIDGFSYLPPQAEGRPPGFITAQLDRLIEATHTLDSPVNQSFFLMTRLPYLQPFYDANKRTSRIGCNIPLISRGLTPMSFVDFDKGRYLAGMIAFYELGDERLAKDAFLDAYLSSAFRYLPFTEAQRVILATEKDQHVADAKRFILEGVMENTPIWRKKASDAPLRPSVAPP
ncbi:Fic family protein [Candidatus Glomeribacter gigasporarum]|uniref:Fic family protein n=1 Tax=Candidatus Glomeribacter gigasporarum TaxID=132144 RepID=UPI0013152209|nr:Fic family protein [Candidatus Glomeribacter gigasporarum]